MPVDGDGQLAEIRLRAEDRLRVVDWLAAPPSRASEHCAELFTATGSQGNLAGVARCAHWEGEPGSLDLVWGAARRFSLVPQIAGGPVDGVLHQLLRQWRDHLRQIPEAAEDDTAAIVEWPSRDIDGVATLLAHGLVPFTVVAARVTGKHAGEAEQVQAPSGVLIRRAGMGDLDAIAWLGLEEIRFDAHFGCVVERPFALASMRDYAAPLLADPESWAWIAERDGNPVGMALAEAPEAARWIASLTALTPAAYLMSMFVTPAERGSRLGTALAQRFHDELEAHGVPVGLLHYEQFNPLSVPFWSQQGYRPLWSTFEARPARALT